MQSGTTAINTIRIYDPGNRAWIMTPMVTLFGAGCRNSLMSMDQQFISRGCWQARSGACPRCIRQRHDVNHGEADAFEGQPMEQVAPRTLASASRTVSALVFLLLLLDRGVSGDDLLLADLLDLLGLLRGHFRGDRLGGGLR